MIRAIEYVYYHHPNARVVIHSNSLPLRGSRLDIFTETGFDLTIQRYDIATLLHECPLLEATSVNRFLAKLPNFEKGQYWYSHGSDLLRYLILWKYGGVYLDTDMYVQQPIPASLNNAMGYQDPRRQYINGAAMIFEAQHVFLKKAIEQVLHVYNDIKNPTYSTDCWSCVGPLMITDMFKTMGTMGVQLLDSTAFQPVEWENAATCFTEPISKLSYVNLTKAYAFHLNTKETAAFATTKAGTLCDQILHQYCIFCDEIHTQGHVDSGTIAD